MLSLMADIFYALRQLRHAPVYALTAVLTLALGLRAATAMLAIVDSVLIRPVPLPHPDRLAHLGRIIGGLHEDVFLPRDIEALRAEAKSFPSTAAYNSLPSPVTTASETRVVGNMFVLPGFFDVPRVPARLGRLPSAEEGDAPWAVVSDAFLRDTLHGNPHAIGTEITVAGRPLTLIGVLQPDFRFSESAKGSFVITPLLLGANGRDMNNFNGSSEVIARLESGVTLKTALAEAEAVYSHLPPVRDYERGVLTMSPYRDLIVGDVQSALSALLGACGLMLLMLCGNTANLQIARAAGRLPEIRVRAALGATRGRLLRQIATESLAVSILGVGAGLTLAYASIEAIRAAYSSQLPRFDELAIHPAAFAACALLAVLAGLRAVGGPGLAQGTRTPKQSRLSSSLVAIEVGLTCKLLVAAGLLFAAVSAHAADRSLTALLKKALLAQGGEQLLRSITSVQLEAHEYRN